MRILLVGGIYPFPPHVTGAHRRLYPILRRLSENHDLTFALLSADSISVEESRKVFPKLKKLISVSHRRPNRGLSRYFTIFWEYNVPEYAEILDSLIKENEFDVIYVYASAFAQYIPVLSKSGACKIIDTVDCHSLYLERRIATAKSLRSRLSIRHDAWLAGRSERAHYSKFDACFTVAPPDSARIRKQCPNLRVETVPLGVDTDYFKIERTSTPRPTAVFSGNMAYADNASAAVYLAREIFPKIRAKIPEAGLILAGGNPGAEVLALGSLPGVTVTGFVDDLRTVYQKSDISVSPLLSGAGIKSKILEAMSMEIPVIMTSLASDGLVGITPAEGIIVDGTDEIAEAAVSLLKDKTGAGAMAKAGREYVIKNFAEGYVCDMVESIIREVLDGKSSGRRRR